MTAGSSPTIRASVRGSTGSSLADVCAATGGGAAGFGAGSLQPALERRLQDGQLGRLHQIVVDARGSPAGRFLGGAFAVRAMMGVRAPVVASSERMHAASS